MSGGIEEMYEEERRMETYAEKVKRLSSYATTEERLEIIRRIAERGMKLAHQNPKNNEFIDIFQHLLDELERIKR